MIYEKNSPNLLQNKELKLFIAELSYHTFLYTMTNDLLNDKNILNEHLELAKIKSIYKELIVLGYEPNQIFLIIELASREYFLNK